MKMDRKKLGIIGIVILLIIAVFLIVYFAAKSSTKVKKDNKNSNYTLKFTSEQNGVKISELDFKYKQKQLQDITLVLFYDDKDIASEIASLYKQEKSFTNVEQEENKIILHYGEEEFNKYSRYNKEELIEFVKSMGYTYNESK